MEWKKAGVMTLGEQEWYFVTLQGKASGYFQGAAKAEWGSCTPLAGKGREPTEGAPRRILTSGKETIKPNLKGGVRPGRGGDSADGNVPWVNIKRKRGPRLGNIPSGGNSNCRIFARK